MDLPRLILFMALAFVVLLLWEAWQEDYRQPAGQPPAQGTARAPAPSDTPALPSAPPQGADAPEAPGTPAKPAPALESRERVTVETDVLRLEIDTLGGDIRHAELPQYPVSLDQPDNPVVLLDDATGQLFVAQAGLRPGSETAVEAAPDHHARFTAERAHFRMRDGADQLQVRLDWTSPEGIHVQKVYTFRRGDYVFDVDYVVDNGSEQPWQGHMYRQLQRTRPAEQGAFGIYTYTGGVIYTPEKKYEKVDFDDMAESPLNREAEGGWTAMIQHYFLSAWVPPQEETNHYYSRDLGDGRFLLGTIGDGVTVAPGEQGRLGARLFVGPKLQHRLEAIAPGLDLTVDYGFLTVLAKPIYWLLEKIHSLVGNWGWSIILLTLLIKLAFYKLSETSYKSMAQMRKLQPRMQQIKERYGDDRQKMNEAMMKLYKEEKINPLGGCLPILVQIPVFIALYWVLLESVELRQAPFILWIQDLSTKDPYFVLPIIMGASMILQHRLNPTPMDPIQAKVMMLLPLVFTVFFAFFPAGLVLYWVVNNILSIAQQWYITRRVVKSA